jgi:hypothetical protein
MRSTSFFLLTALIFGVVGCSSSSTTADKGQSKSPDEQLTALMADYERLSAAEKVGPKGEAILTKMKPLVGEASTKTKEEVARFHATINLRQITISKFDTHSNEPVDKAVPGIPPPDQRPPAAPELLPQPPEKK